MLLSITTMKTLIGRFILLASIRLVDTLSLTQVEKDMEREASLSEITQTTITRAITPDTKMRTEMPTITTQITQGIRPPPIMAQREAATTEAKTLATYVSDILTL